MSAAEIWCLVGAVCAGAAAVACVVTRPSATWLAGPLTAIAVGCIAVALLIGLP